MNTSKDSMWLPRGFAGEVQADPWNGKYCFFDATQRGDMYHIRAWQTLQKGKAVVGGAWHPPTIIYNYIPAGEKNSNETTVEYITEIIPQGTWKFVTRWSWEKLTDDKAGTPTHEATKYDDGSRDNSTLEWAGIGNKLSIGPSECTDGIRDSADRQRTDKKEKKEFTIIPENMVKVNPDSKELLNQLDLSYKTSLPEKATPDRKVAIILWRDTLASGGPYPELNTGARSANQLITMLKSFGIDVAFIDVAKTALEKAMKDVGEVLEPGVHCGETPYFAHAVLKSNLWPQSAARDREAFWVKRAYDQKRFDLVVGLRSGALDNMTFLGIPTVSIGLQDMIGEGRMHKLGGNVFQRINVDYGIPRHAGTALVQSRHGDDFVFKSPVGQITGVAALSSFTPFDARTVRIGILLAATKYLNSTGPESISPDLQDVRLVTARENRAHWDGRNYTNKDDWNKDVKALEETDYAWRAEEQHRKDIGESKERWDDARKRMQASWDDLRKRVETRAADKGKSSVIVDKTTVKAGRDQKKADKAARAAAAMQKQNLGGTQTGAGGPPKA